MTRTLPQSAPTYLDTDLEPDLGSGLDAHPSSSLCRSGAGPVVDHGTGRASRCRPDPQTRAVTGVSSAASARAQRRIVGSRPESGPLPVRITAADTRSMPRSVPALIGRVRRELESRVADRGHAGGTVVVDLSELPVLGAAMCSPLILLIRLLHELVAPAEVVVVGVASTVRACLVGGLPDGVRLVDRRGRSWPH